MEFRVHEQKMPVETLTRVRFSCPCSQARVPRETLSTMVNLKKRQLKGAAEQLRARAKRSRETMQVQLAFQQGVLHLRKNWRIVAPNHGKVCACVLFVCMWILVSGRLPGFATCVFSFQAEDKRLLCVSHVLTAIKGVRPFCLWSALVF